MIGGSRIGRGAVAAAALLGAVIVAAPASAGTPTVSLGSVGTIEYLRNSDDEVLSQDDRSASCNGSDSAIGGGGAISGSSGNSFLNATHPTASPGWNSAGRTTGVTARTLTTYVICGEQPTTFSAEGTSFTTGNDPQAFQTNFGGPCPGSETEIGSGLEVTAGDLRLIRNRPPPPAGTGWTTAENVHASQSTGATFWTGCTSGYQATNRTAKTKVKPGDAGTAAAACKRSEAVIAGGFESLREGLPARSTWLTSSRPFDSKQDRRKVPDDGWRATVHNGSSAKILLRAVAICAGL